MRAETLCRLDVFAAVVASGAASLMLSSCAMGCDEVGYRNELRVTVTGENRDNVTDVRLCADGICAYHSQEAAPSTGRSYWVTHAVSDLWTYDFGDHHPIPCN
ncbi:hypothetical protein GRS96_19765 (plasmid) [Rathayibacter sp. VKM Ac-2803]|uniref:Secreted protein n=1 Tax=Rathayibacter caricis DSM 15933 TaxID=1328867 RepID=A0A2T4UP87_9MICO|nr:MULTISPECIES: hypothetical protein [Rathayibacter]MWV51505.1 hypothetical protein [Rathayibacter sp. VKM Ac-2803]PTL71329.1 hypothetical protein C1I63_19090 [Rathayibacter caricis DSM 15933]